MDFLDKFKQYKNNVFIIHKDSDVNCDSLESKVKDKYPDINVNGKFDLIYAYYLVDKEYKYPSGDSNILYIGCTIGEKKGKVRSAAFRFMHLKGNSDNKQNITLHKFYDNGEVIGLIISDCNGTSCKDIEKKLRYEFLNEFGALPIADGSSYSSKKDVLLFNKRSMMYWTKNRIIIT